jgi:hypothetical protein
MFVSGARPHVGKLRFCRAGALGWLMLLRKPTRALFLLFGASLVGLAFSAISAGYPFIMVTSFCGGLAALRLQDDAILEVNATVKDLIIARMNSSRFIHTPDLDRWTPPLPRLLRWNDTYIEVKGGRERLTEPFTVKGPYVLLKRLSRFIDVPR